MLFSHSTLDDLMHEILTELINRPFHVVSSRSKDSGSTSEIIGAMLHLKNPRCRLSRDEAKGTVFSALGELLWYLAGSKELGFISYYINAYKNETEDGETVYGGYGPRLFNFREGINQIDNIIKLLKERSTSRKAVIQLFDAEDLVGRHKEIPCTCTLQFFVRENKLHMFTSMRSNDAYKGLPHDVFAFTMLQEIIARSLDTDIGEYYHAVGSLHLYENEKVKAQEYLNAGFQPTQLQMPEMPYGQPWREIKDLLKIEQTLRSKGSIDFTTLRKLHSYWADLAHLLHAYSIFKDSKPDDSALNEIELIKKRFSSKVYNSYIVKKEEDIIHRKKARNNL